MAEDSAINIELNDSDLSDSNSSCVMIDHENISSSEETSPKGSNKEAQIATPSSASKRKRHELEDDYNRGAGGDSDLESFIEMERQSPEPRRKNPTPVPTPQKPSKELDNSNIPDEVLETSKSSDFDDNLPETVTLLRCPDGGKVYIVGTAHFSTESQDDVGRVIQAVKPNRVVVELCASRTDILLNDEEAVLAAAKDMNFQKIMAIVKKHGAVQGMLYITLLTMSAHVTKELGMAPGGEFRRAFREAESVPGCEILLGDRPINVTMARLMSSLSWWQCAKLFWNLVVSKESIKKEDVENAKKRDFLEAMLAEMAGEFPSMKEVLVTERDKYLAYSLQNAVSTFHYQKLSMPGERFDSANRVVGVVGIGHMAGIKEHFGHVSEKDLHDLMFVPPPSLTSRVLRTGFRLVIFGGAAYAIYKVVPVQRVVNLVRPAGKFF